MGTAIALMAALWAAQQFGAIPRLVDALWFSLIGACLTVAIGSASALLRGSQGTAVDPA